MQTYYVGRRIRHHRHFWMAVAVLATLGLGVLVVYSLMHTTTTPSTTIYNAPPLSTSYVSDSTLKMHVDEPLFTLDLPAGWKAIPSVTSVNTPSYTFSSPSAQARELDVFIDNIPSSLALNRVVTVNARGTSMDHQDVSENCATFTPATNSASGVVAGKWQGTSFLCDEGNYERDVVGIASSEGVNFVILTGPTAGTHKIFMTYTDNNINPNFSVLYAILESFKLK